MKASFLKSPGFLSVFWTNLIMLILISKSSSPFTKPSECSTFNWYHNHLHVLCWFSFFFSSLVRYKYIHGSSNTVPDFFVQAFKIVGYS